ncbi:uncharacterized protein LOC129989174 [Argiope bruennichi]|uniref:uncharacterized protein LOC129989174 n=1 Tax=Argiope bruennichi TaxID=94029 RepID=UPI0024952957|nr:uncharacterized protein LOC129989174 [Argiope bruennichi]
MFYLLIILVLNFKQSYSINIKFHENAREDLDHDPETKLDTLPFKCEFKNLSDVVCCRKLPHIQELRLLKKICIELTYVGKETKLNLKFMANGITIYNSALSGNNPPPVCPKIHHGLSVVDICFDFYNVQIKLHKLNVCLALNPRVLRRNIMNINVGCFTFSG